MEEVIILTEGQYLKPEKTDWYIDQIQLEDGLVQKAFENHGYKVRKADWSDNSNDWSNAKHIVFRSIWDYFHRFDEFEKWLESVSHLTNFVNPIAQIQWNMDKHYLLDLEKKGIPIVESYFIEAGDSRTLKAIHAETGWTKTVIKPCVSGGGRHTYLLNPKNLEEHEQVYSEVIANEAMILQPFQEQITSKGEVSHMVIGGKHTHSILKKAKEGDYRVQDDFGGTVHEYQATQEEIDFAEKVAKSCDPLPAYARIDVIWDNDDNLVISEVELIEPELWFRENHDSAQQLADFVHQKG